MNKDITIRVNGKNNPSVSTKNLKELTAKVDSLERDLGLTNKRLDENRANPMVASLWVPTNMGHEKLEPNVDGFVDHDNQFEGFVDIPENELEEYYDIDYWNDTEYYFHFNRTTNKFVLYGKDKTDNQFKFYKDWYWYDSEGTGIRTHGGHYADDEHTILIPDEYVNIESSHSYSCWNATARHHDTYNWDVALGKFVLVKNILTQEMMVCNKTIYHIQYDFDLDGKTIIVPEGCILDFDGGSLSNGTLVGEVMFNKPIDVRELGLIYNQKSAAIQNTNRLQILSGLTSDIHLIISDTLYLGEGSVTIKGSLNIDGKENTIYLDTFSGINVGKDVSITSVKVFGASMFDTSNNESFFIESVASDYNSSIYITNCYFSGKLRVIASTNYSDALLTKYHNTISFTNNIFENICPRPSSVAIRLDDVNFINLIFKSNIVHNFYGIIIDVGITNGTEHVTNIKNFYEKNGRTVTFKDNVISNDKELKPWEHFAPLSYYTPLLAETGDCIYEHNVVTDIITNNTRTALYSAYLSVSNLIFQNNTIKNCVNLAGSHNELLKAKMGGGTRYYYKNTFVIEKSIEDYFSDIENIDISTHLIDIQGDILNSLIIKDNIFNIYKLDANFNYKVNAARIELSNNIFNIELLNAANNAAIIGTGVGDFSRNIHISKNRIFVDNFYNVTATSKHFVLLGKVNTGDDIVCIENNHLKNLTISYNTNGRILGEIKGNDLKINNNYIGANANLCGLSPSYDLTISNNTTLFEGYDIPSSSRLFMYVLDSCIIDWTIEFNSNNSVRLFDFRFLSGIYKLDILIVELSTGATIKNEINLEASDMTIQRCLSYDNNGNLTEFTARTNLYNFGDYTTAYCQYTGTTISLNAPNAGKHYFKLSLTKIQDFYKLNNYIGEGVTAKRPTLLQANNVGFRYFDTTLGFPVYWDGTKWVDEKGYTALPSTSTLDTLRTTHAESGANDEGMTVFLSDVEKPAYLAKYWNIGSDYYHKWVYMDGTVALDESVAHVNN